VGGLFVGLVSILGVTVALNLPVLFYHALVFEGTGNHDSFYYTVVAHYMQHHSFYEPVIYTPEQPYNEVARWTFGNAAPIGRVGAEGYLAWGASLFGRNPAFLYNAMSTCGMIVAGLCCLLLLSPVRLREMRHKVMRIWLVPVALSTPALYESVFNSNYSTLYGVAFFTAYLSASWMRSRVARLVLSVLFLTAMLASYPELIPMAWACLGLGLLIRWRFCWRFTAQMVRDGLRMLRDVACSIVLFLWVAIPAWYVVVNAYVSMNGTGSGSGRPDVDAGLTPAQHILATLMANRHIGDILPGVLAAIILGLLVFVVAVGTLRSGRNATLLGGICSGFLVIMVIMYFHSYSYGKLKVIEYFTPPLMAAAISGGIFAWDKSTAGLVKTGILNTLFIAVFAVMIFAVGTIVSESLLWGKLKRITPATMGLVKAIRALPRGSYIALGSTPWPYYYSMWIPYLSNGTFLYSTGFGSGGYFSSYVKQHPVAPITDAQYLIQSADAWVGVPYPKTKQARYGDFELQQLKDADSVSVNGLYKIEGRHAWMGKSLELSVRHLDTRVNYINVFFGSRFNPVGEKELIDIRRNNRQCVVEVGTHGQGLSIRLDDSRIENMEMIPRRPPQSPYELGIGGDPRMLTFDITELSFSRAPKYHAIQCQP